MLRGLAERERTGHFSLVGQHAVTSYSTLQRLQLERRLEGHHGCVNTISFSPDGQLLASGSDDLQVILWDWQAGTRRLAFESCKRLITAAADGQVRLAVLAEAGTAATQRLARHRGRAHKLAIEPGSSHCFLSSGEDGEVRHYDLREPASGQRRLLVCTTTGGYPLELNSVHFHPTQPQFCVGGGDAFCRVFDLRKPVGGHLAIAEPVRRLAPAHLRGGGRGRLGATHITCAVYSEHSASADILASYNDEHMYLFGAEERKVSAGQASARRQAAGRKASKRMRRSDDASGLRSVRHVRESYPGVAGGATVVGAQEMAAAASAHASVRRSLLLDDLQPADLSMSPSLAATGQGVGADLAAGRPRARGAAACAVIGDVNLSVEAAAQADQDLVVEGTRSATLDSQGIIAECGSDSSAEGPSAHALGGGIGMHAVSMGNEPHGSSSSATTSGSSGTTGRGRSSEIDEDFGDEGAELQPRGLDSGGGNAATERHTGGVLQDTMHSASSSGAEDEMGYDSVLQVYKGHRNAQTVKGCSFFGDRHQVVLSGSDCGGVYMWDRLTGSLVMLLENADSHVVNCLEPSPTYALTLATSGIDDDIKVWGALGDEPLPPGVEAEARMAANTRRQGSRAAIPAMLTPEVLQMLLMRQRMEPQGSDSDSDADGPRPAVCVVQ